MNADISAGIWQKLECRALNECSLGVIGVGNIGKAVVRRARAFGMYIRGNDIAAIDPRFATQYNLNIVSRKELLRESDFVSLNCDLNETSYHLMRTEAFSEMRPAAVVINTARGAIVDEPALIRALQDGTIAGVALDVFEQGTPVGRQPPTLNAECTSRTA